MICQSWCGLPLSDPRVPLPGQADMYFATEEILVDSPTYCCPQLPADVVTDGGPIAAHAANKLLLAEVVMSGDPTTAHRLEGTVQSRKIVGPRMGPILDLEPEWLAEVEKELVAWRAANPERPPPSQELRLRRMLAEWAIGIVAEAEVNGRSFEPPSVAHAATLAYFPEADVSPYLEAAVTAREREGELLWNSRLPNWETDEPPPLTAEQAAVLAKHVAAGARSPGYEAYKELTKK